MSYFNPSEVEAVIVDRLRAMLEDETLPIYNVTHCYSLFCTILLWTTQVSKKASNFVLHPDSDPLREFRVLELSDLSWDGLQLEEQHFRKCRSKDKAVLELKEPKLRAVDVLMGLRNAVAHGNSDNTTPLYDEKSRRSAVLKGFRFYCRTEIDLNRGYEWIFHVSLSEAQMRQIGLNVARIFFAAVGSTLELSEPKLAA